MQFTSKFLLRKKCQKRFSSTKLLFFAVFVYFSFFLHNGHFLLSIRIESVIQFYRKKFEVKWNFYFYKKKHNILDLLSKGPESPKSIIFRITTSSNHSTRSEKIQLLDRECRSRFTKIMSCTNSVVSFQQANVSSGFKSFWNWLFAVKGVIFMD